MESYSIENILEELKNRLDIRTDLELSKIFRVKPNTISTWKKRNTINYKRLVDICNENSIKLDKLFNYRESESTNKEIGT